MHTHISLDTKAFAHNINLLKAALGKTQLALVLKSNAYGHGLLEMGQQAEQLSQVDWICTAGLTEAIELRQNNIHKKLLVLSYLDADLSQAILLDIHCPIYDFETAQELSYLAQKLRKKVNVHIKVDTGMSRLGILPHETVNFVRAVSQLPYITIYGIFTHLCDTPNPDPSFSYTQLDTFDSVLDLLAQAGIIIPCTHALASSGLCVVPKRSYTLARIGGLAFGLWKTESHKARVLRNYPALKNICPVLTWKTNIIQVKNIPVGSFIGYDRTYQAPKDMRIAMLSVGYFDGYPRSLSNTGVVLVNNQEAPILGIISMNLMTIDVTHIPSAKKHDEVVLLGSHQSIQPLACAQRAKLITNELVARINSEIPRALAEPISQTIHEPDYQPDLLPEVHDEHGQSIAALKFLLDLNKLP